MDYIEITGGKRLFGDIKIQGSKNSVLPIMAACILNNGSTVLTNCPRITDVDNMVNILKELGCTVLRDRDVLIINSEKISEEIISDKYAKALRSSIIFAGALIGRTGKVKISYPGGCTIGKRPIDWHLEAFRRLGAEVIEKEYIECYADKIVGSDLRLLYPSVGVTENIILASVLAHGTVRIFNYAKEPEILELCEFLNRMGANISIDMDKLTIVGVEKLHDCHYRIKPDRIVAGTYLIAVAATGGKVNILDVKHQDISSLINILRAIGSKIKIGNDYISITSEGNNKNIELLQTQPFPEFPTDLQPQIMSLLVKANGKSVIEENVFEGRYKTAYELIKLGANIEIDGKRAYIEGKEKLIGTSVNAQDLRSGAALIIAGLIADGSTEVNNIEYIKRGYEDIVRDFVNVGADVKILDRT